MYMEGTGKVFTWLVLALFQAIGQDKCEVDSRGRGAAAADGHATHWDSRQQGVEYITQHIFTLFTFTLSPHFPSTPSFRSPYPQWSMRRYHPHSSFLHTTHPPTPSSSPSRRV